MPIQYVKGSFAKIGDRAFEFGVKNTEGSGKVKISASVFLDGKDLTGSSSIKINNENFKKIDQAMDLDITMGEVITIRMEPAESIPPGAHTIKILINVMYPLWASFESEFKVKL